MSLLQEEPIPPGPPVRIDDLLTVTCEYEFRPHKDGIAFRLISHLKDFKIKDKDDIKIHYLAAYGIGLTKEEAMDKAAETLYNQIIQDEIIDNITDEYLFGEDVLGV